MTDKPERVHQAFAAWQARREELQAKSQVLEAALRSYTEGTGPMPSELMDEVHALRRDCDALFKDVLAAVGDRAS